MLSSVAISFRYELEFGGEGGFACKTEVVLASEAGCGVVISIIDVERAAFRTAGEWGKHCRAVDVCELGQRETGVCAVAAAGRLEYFGEVLSVPVSKDVH